MPTLLSHLSIVLCLALLAANTQSQDLRQAKEYSYRVVAEHPYSRQVFTQGLEFHNDLLYQSSGRYGRSSLSVRTLQEPKTLQLVELENRYFAEGLTILNGKLYQLTWREQTAFVYELSTLEIVKQFSYKGEGWGLTNNGKQLIMSDGTASLRFIDPENFNVIKTLKVTNQGRPVANLNELEWVNGLIYANIWKTNKIAIIDPDSGNTRGLINLDGLLPRNKRSASTDVLNGIAYLPEQNRLFVTGKNWPILYEIRISPFKRKE